MHSGLRRVPLWLVAFAGFFLLGTGWGVAAPFDGGPDERAHIIKAVGVYWDGPLPKPVAAWRNTGTIQHVPAAFFPGDLYSSVPTTDFPAEMPGDPPPLVATATYTGRYNVVYYAIVGLPLRIWPNWTGLCVARILNAGMIAGLLAAAVAAVCRSRHRAFLGGPFVAVTPIMMHLAGTINPNGVEAAAGFLLFASLIPPLFEADGRLPQTTLWQSGAAAVVLATVRVLGPLWLVVALVVLLSPLRSPMRVRLRRTPGLKPWIAVVSIAVVAGVAWTLIFKAYELAFVTGAGHDYTLSAAARTELFVRWSLVIEEFVGVTGHNNIRIPGPFYLIWFSLFGFYLLGALALGRRFERFRIIALLAATFVGPTVADVRNLHRLGFQIQGRYLLPLVTGALMLAAHALARRLPDERAATAAVRTTATIAVPIHLIFLAMTMVYWQIGFPLRSLTVFDQIPLNPLGGHWHPPLGSATPLVLAVFGAAALLACAWYPTPLRHRDDDRGRSPHPEDHVSICA